jgi:hypothetical protein
LGVSAGGSVSMSPSAVLGHAQHLEGHAVTVGSHAQQFSAAAGGISFE